MFGRMTDVLLAGFLLPHFSLAYDTSGFYLLVMAKSSSKTFLRSDSLEVIEASRGIKARLPISLFSTRPNYAIVAHDRQPEYQDTLSKCKQRRHSIVK